MIKLTTLDTVKSKYIESKTIEELQKIVQNNPQKDLIERARSCEYKSKEYDKIKLKLNCVMPHGQFIEPTNAGIKRLSGLLFYDIDGILNEQELNDTIKYANDTFPIYFLQKSVSGKGFHFLININDTLNNPDDTFFSIGDSFVIKNDTLNKANDTFSFDDVYLFVRNELVNSGLNIDIAASGLSRKMILSYDPNCIYNPSKSYKIDIDRLNDFINKDKVNLSKLKLNKKKESKEQLEANDTLQEKESFISIKEFKSKYFLKKKINKKIEGDFLIEEMDYKEIFIKNDIPDGNKTSIYKSMIYTLYFINENMTKNDAISFILYVNSIQTIKKMDKRKLILMIGDLCDDIEKGNKDLYINTKKKYIHFNNESKLTKNQKMSIGAQIGGKMKNNKTITKIIDAIISIENRGEIATQKKVVTETGLSLSTVKRNWNKGLNDLYDIKYERLSDDKKMWISNFEQQASILDTMPILNINDFFNETTQPTEIVAEMAEKQPKIEDFDWDEWQPVKNSRFDEINKDFGDGIEIDGFIESGTIDNNKNIDDFFNE